MLYCHPYFKFLNAFLLLLLLLLLFCSFGLILLFTIFTKKMNMQEEFFKEQLKVIHESRDADEEKFEMLQQEEREKVKQSNAACATSNAEEYRHR